MLEESEVEKPLLLNDLNFITQPKRPNNAGCLVNWKFFYRDICNLEVLSVEDLDLIKTKSSTVFFSQL